MFKQITPIAAATILAGCAIQAVPSLPTANHPASAEGAETRPLKRSATLRVIEPVTEKAPAEIGMTVKDRAREGHHHGH